MKARQTNQGFTLIELLIVIAIIGLLATLAIVSLTTAQQKARDAKRIADVKQLQNAVELYYSENAAYPDSGDATNDTWAEFGTTLTSYLTNMPQDPTNSGTDEYVYGTNDANSQYFIGAELEADNDALAGDDDTAYVTTLSGWSGLDTVESTDTTPATVSAFDCADSSFHYCASE
jgi:type II secretion system protein G